MLLSLPVAALVLVVVLVLFTAVVLPVFVVDPLEPDDEKSVLATDVF